MLLNKFFFAYIVHLNWNSVSLNFLTSAGNRSFPYEWKFLLLRKVVWRVSLDIHLKLLQCNMLIISQVLKNGITGKNSIQSDFVSALIRDMLNLIDFCLLVKEDWNVRITKLRKQVEEIFNLKFGK